jgi:hypothetical protein
MKRQIFFILISVFCLWTTLQAGEIYEWVDKDGVKHLSDRPPPPGVKIIHETREIPHSKASDEKRMPEGQQTDPLTEQQAVRQPNTQEPRTGYSDSDDSDGEVVVDPYARHRERVRHHERGRVEGEAQTSPRHDRKHPVRRAR